MQLPVVTDLGRLSGPLLVFGGVLSNLPALEALRAYARQQGIGAAQVIFTGDMLGYCAQPGPVIAAMRDWQVAGIAGNVERQLADDANTCGCGFVPGSTCDRLSAGWYAFARSSCSAQDRTWMRGLPDIVTFTHADLRYAVVHGGASDIARFLWPASSDADFHEEWQALHSAVGPVDRVLAGHCGLAFQKHLAVGSWINAGVIGMPPNDGAPATRFARLDAQGEVTIMPLQYDHHSAASAMRQAGLTQGYDTALISGRWPSQDILPLELRTG